MFSVLEPFDDSFNSVKLFVIFVSSCLSGSSGSSSSSRQLGCLLIFEIFYETSRVAKTRHLTLESNRSSGYLTLSVKDFSRIGVLINQAAAWFWSGSRLINQAAISFLSGRCLIDQAAAWYQEAWYQTVSDFNISIVFAFKLAVFR